MRVNSLVRLAQFRHDKLQSVLSGRPPVFCIQINGNIRVMANRVSGWRRGEPGLSIFTKGSRPKSARC